MTLPILLGEAPGDKRVGDLRSAPLRSLAVRLVKWAGWEPELELDEPDASYATLVSRFHCRNVYPTRQGAYPWRQERARLAWAGWYLLDSPPGPLTVVTLGRRATAAVGGSHRWGRWLQTEGLRTVAIPHPSGRNILLNDPEMRELCGRVLREASGQLEVVDRRV